MEELITQTRRELIDLPAAWKRAGLGERRELCEMLFPSGLVWGHEWGFLNSKNKSIVQDLRASWLDDSDDVKFGVPLNGIFEHLDSTIAEATPLYELCTSVLQPGSE